MVIVVKFLAGDQETNRQQVPRVVHRIVVSVAPVMSGAIDDASKSGHPEHLERPNSEPRQTEQGQVDAEHDHETKPRVLVHVTLHPVIRRAIPVLRENERIALCLAVPKVHTEQDSMNPKMHRTMRIRCGLGGCMVIPVHRNPFTGCRTSQKPCCEPKHIRGERMENQ